MITRHSKLQSITQQSRTITPKMAAEIYSLSMGTLANLRSKRQGCPYLKVNRKVLYRVEDFEKWLTAEPVQTYDNTSTA